MADLDWVFLAVLALSALVGAIRGLVTEVMSFLSWVLAFVLADLLAPWAAFWVPMGVASEGLRYAGGYVSVFVAALLLGSLLLFVLNKAMSISGLRPIDRVLGVAFGAARGAVLLLAITVVVGMTPVRKASWWLEAQGPLVAQAALAGLKPLLPGGFAKFLP